MAKKLKMYFDYETINLLADKLSAHIKDFPHKSFVTKTLKDVQAFELKDRVKIIGTALNNYIPGDYSEKVAILNKILGPENPSDFGTFNNYFWIWPISSVVEQFGIDHKKDSINLIYEITKRSTGEFAIRPFIRQDPKTILKQMNEWSKDKNFHVRRLSSEGLRPRLPWATKLDLFIENPTPTIKILKRLKNDNSKYVQNSVANHLGDLLKLNYDYTINLLLEWNINPKPNTKWIIKHAVRNLRKKGDPMAMSLSE